MKKRRHHYVWQEYLRAWATNGQIFSLREGKIFPSNTANVAQERDFYKPSQLTPKDIDFLHRFVESQQSKILKGLNKDWVNIFDFGQSLQRIAPNNPQFQLKLDELVHNMEEELHSRIEISAIDLLHRLRVLEHGCLDDEEARHTFFFFLSEQYFRTKKMRDEMLKDKAVAQAFNLDAIWNPISHILATNVAWALFSTEPRFEVHLLKNETSVEFVTGDQPIINRAAPVDAGKMPEVLDCYYPISPSVALLIVQKPARNPITSIIDIDRVNAMNKRFRDMQHEFVFAKSQTTLERL